MIRTHILDAPRRFFIMSRAMWLSEMPPLRVSRLERESGILPKEQISNIGFIHVPPDGLAYTPMMGRIFASRIGLSRIASEECGLATAPAKVNLSLWTGSTWLRHPFGAAKLVEAFGFFPDLQHA
jgi:hypothetical protein